MTENQRIGGKEDRCTTHTDTWHTITQKNDSHATGSQAGYKYITHVHIQAMIIKMNSDKDNMLKDNQGNVQVDESTHQVEKCTTMSLYMRGE